MQVVLFFCTQFQNFWYITRFSISKHRSNAQISMLNPCVTVKFGRILGNKYVCKLGKEYLNALLCKFVIYSLQPSETFHIYTSFYH